MGQPKALLSYRGVTFLQHLLDVTRHPRVGPQLVVLGAGEENIRSHFSASAAQIVLNSNWSRGQLSSIQSAVRHLVPMEVEGMILCPVDHPLVSALLIHSLVRAFDTSQKSIIVPVHGRRRGHPVIFRSNLFDELLAASDDVGAREVVRAHPGDIQEVETAEEGVLLNLNDPDTLHRALGKS